MRRISLVEFESICKNNGYNFFSATNDDSTSFDFSMIFKGIEFYYNTITLKNDAYYLRLRDIVSVSVDESFENSTIQFIIVCEEYLPKCSFKVFTISAKRS